MGSFFLCTHATPTNRVVHLVYAESPGGPSDRYRIHYTRSLDAGRTFEMPREISSPPSAAFESVNFPALSVDGRDNVYVLWELFRSRRDYSTGLGSTYSRDAGRTFAPPTVVPGTVDPALGVNGSQQGLLMRKLAVNEAGAIAVVNSTFRRNESSRIWLFRGKPPSADERTSRKGPRRDPGDGPTIRL
jgi:hypothetical protein